MIELFWHYGTNPEKEAEVAEATQAALDLAEIVQNLVKI